MSKVKGGQLENSTISQTNMSIQTNTIVSGTSVTNKEYLIQQINEKSTKIHQSVLNQHMTARVATIGQKACDSTVIEFPISTILVKVNGTQVNVGVGQDCYFSPNGVIIRSGGSAQKGDYLYWNSSNYNLDTNDEIDFDYLTNVDYVTLSGGTTISLDPIFNSLVVKYIGGIGSTMTVIIDGVSILVGNSGGSFVWDIGGINYIFTNPNESTSVRVNGKDYTVWFDGFGSLIYSIKNGDVIPSDLFKIEIQITGTSQSITLPHLSGYTYNYTVDYGDGSGLKTVTTYNGTGATHIYTNPGTYTIKISGTCETFYVNSGGTMVRTIKNIISWGNVGIKVVNFYGCLYLSNIAGDGKGLSKVISFQNTFWDCILLNSIPSGIFDYCTGLTTNAFFYTFRNCKSLTSIPAHLFDNNTGVTSYAFSGIFVFCSGITTIPDHLFDYNVNVTSYAFNNAFNSCLSLTSIPTDLFKYNILASDMGFQATFQSCTSLTSIPPHLFDTNTALSVGGLQGTFGSCTSLTSIPPHLFDFNTGLTTSGFANTFRNCQSLTTIPDHLFDYNTLVSTSAFSSTFNMCTGITAIPVDLFKYNTLVSYRGFRDTFSGCWSITSIPAHLFDNQPLLYDMAFGGTFLGTAITEIPVDLFKYNTLVSAGAFVNTFYACYFLTSIPNDIFKYNVNVGGTGFNGTFAYCSTLTSIPTDLFRYNTGATTNCFTICFIDCTGITSIPSDLFRYNTLVSSNGFQQTFQGCKSLTTLPTDLFRYNTAASTYCFNKTFSGCTNLETVPELLFKYNINVSTQGFKETFAGCDKLQLNPWIFYASGETGTRFLNKVSDFTDCFARTGFTGTQGTAPDLWNCSFGTQTPIKIRCFGGTGNSDTSLTNYSSIPTVWKT